MTTRARPNRGERHSWRERDAPISSPLLFYRRIVATLLGVLFVGLFGLVIWWLLPQQQTWTSKHLIISEYDPGSAPPLVYVEKQKLAWTGSLTSEDVIGKATQADELPTALPKLSGQPGRKRSGPLVVYVAGHGCSQGDDAFLYASDFHPADPKGSSIHVRDLLAAVAAHPARQTLLILDSGPLEHDLRVGTAVNRFPEILASELKSKQLKLADDEELIVLSSHQPWERSFVSPKEQRSVFGFYVNEGLASPTFNADQIRFDQEKPDGQISLLEFAGYVQQRVSGWVWKASNHTRTQRPLLLYARGTLRTELDLVHELERSSTDSDVSTARARLGQIMAPKLKPATPSAAVAGLFSLESAAYAQEAAQPPAAAPAAKGTTDAPPVTAAETTPAKAGDAAPAQPATTAPAAAKEVAEVKDTRPAWLQAQASLVRDWFGGLAAGTAEDWTNSDYDPTSVRRSLRNMLYAQQERLAGDAGDMDAVKFRNRDGWDPLRDWPTDSPAHSGLRHAARMRNLALIRLDQYVSALDAAEGLAHDDSALIDELTALWTEVDGALNRLDESIEQKAFLDTPQSEPEGPTISASSGSVSGSVPDIIAAGKNVEDACQKLEAKLQSLLLAKDSPAVAGPQRARWLPRWDLAQAVPVAAWDRADWPDFAADGDIPPLGFPPPADTQEKSPPAGKSAAPATEKVVLPTKRDVDGVNFLLRQRRQHWIERQAAVATLLPDGAAAAKAIVLPGNNDGQLNNTGLKIAQRHQSAVAWMKDTLARAASADDAPADFSADRVLRLAMAADADSLDLKRLPQPLNLVRREVQSYLLRLDGPRDEIELALGQEREAVFTLQRGNVDLSNAEVKLDVDESLLVTRQGKPIATGDYELKDLLDEQGNIALRISPARELEAKEGKIEDPVKSLKLVLTLDSVAKSKATRVGKFRLPAAPFLDVTVAGFEGTLELASRDVLGGSGANQEFHLNPPPTLVSDGAMAAERGRVKLRLRPLPQGDTPYRLSVVNRSTIPRDVVAHWHVLEDPRPATDWQEVERQIGDSSLRHQLKPQRLQPGEKWLIPLFEEDQKLPPPATPPPAAAAAPAAPAEPKAPPPLLIGTGLVCQLTDVKDPAWTQWIWITAEPRHPDRYVLPRSTFIASRGIVETVLRDHPESTELLPPGRNTLIRGNPGSGRDGKRVAFSQNKVSGVLATGDLKIVAQLPPSNPDDVSDVAFSLDVDGYPRALRFTVGPDRAQVPPDRSAAVQLRLLQKSDPPMPLKEDTLLSRGQLFFPKAPKLRYEIEADFPQDPARYAVRLVRDDSVSAPLGEFYFQRDFGVECQRQPAEESAKANLSLVCRIKELGGPLDWLTSESGYAAPLRIKLRAEIVEIDAQGVFQPLRTAAQDEVELVLDDEPPALTKRPAAQLDWNKKKPLPVIEISLTDDDSAGSGSGIAEVVWGTLRKGDADLMDPQPVSLPASGNSLASLRIAVPQKLLLMEGKPVEILVMAKDRAGNRFGPESIQTINVKALVPSKQVPKGSDSKK